MAKKHLFQKTESRRIIAISLILTLFVTALDGLRWGVTWSLRNIVGFGESLSYFYSLALVVVILLFVINKYKDLLE
ncbi:MAG: hypothetical protein AABY07_03065 [Nanoarchaeota archaeon]